MPLAKGGDLDARVSLYKNNVDSILLIAKQAAEALDVAHRAGIIHRDVKPANILFPEPVAHDIWLADFGICLIRDRDRTTPPAEVVGPIQFMAPELEAGGKLEVTAAADVYSLGKVIYFMLSGGTIIPRERLHESGFASIFADGGERGRLLQSLLSQMICQLSSRLPDMASVLGEIDRIERWAQDAHLLPISNEALASLARLEQQAIEARRLRDDNAAIQSRRTSKLETAKDGVLEWFTARLEEASAHMGQNTVVSRGVRMMAGGDGVPRVNNYIPGSAVELWYRNSSESHHEHILRFSFCTKFQVRIQVSDGTTPAPKPSEPEDAEFGILPAYGSASSAGRIDAPFWSLLTTQGQLYHPENGPNNNVGHYGQHRRAQQLPQPLVQVQMLTLSTANWTTATEQFREAFKNAFDAFVQAITQRPPIPF